MPRTSRHAALTLLVAAALAPAATAGGGTSARPVFGVADDTPKYAEDGGAAFLDRIAAAGLTSIRVMILWDPAQPTAIRDRHFLDRLLPQARAAGISVEAAVRPARAGDVGSSPGRARAFAAFLARLVRTYPQIGSVAVGNEPNQPRFWRPQFRKGQAVSARDYERLLALSYDAVKAAAPDVLVLGGAISSHGNDNPRAVSNASLSPLRFLHDLGQAYRRSRRARPLMDALAFHPYPRSATDDLATGLQWPNVGFADLGRLKQAIWDAFHGTRQPTTEQGLRLVVDEVGWQVAVDDAHTAAYSGFETVPVTSERTQAQVYAEVVRRASCDPDVAALHFFPAVDDVDLASFQSGLMRADGSERPSFAAVTAAIARGCVGRRVRWRHSTRVAGAGATFPRAARHWTRQRIWGFSLRAAEGAAYRASIVRLADGRVVATARGAVNAGWRPRAVFRRSLAPGRYRYVVELRARFAPERRARFAGRPFTVS